MVFLYRPAFYRNRQEADEGESDDTTTEAIIGKQRNGPTGTVHLAFLREYTRFEDLETQRDL